MPRSTIFIFQLLGFGLVFKMPGDPAALDDRVEGPILTAADLLHSVAVKLLPFWPDNIETWLIQSESQFRLKGVTVSQTKFDHVVQSMSQTDAVKVLDLIRAPPPKFLTATSRIIFSGCMALQTTHVLRPFPDSRFWGTCFPQLLCSRC